MSRRVLGAALRAGAGRAWPAARGGRAVPPRTLSSGSGVGADDLRAGRGHYSQEAAAEYAGIGLDEGNFWLIYHHAEAAIRRSLGPGLASSSAIDWGCGAGKSTRWLKHALGMGKVIGADSSEEMLARARLDDPEGTFVLAEDGRCPVPAEAFDLVLSMCVLVEIPSLAGLEAYAAEAGRLLRPGGVAVAVAATEESRDPANEFLSFRYLPASPSDPRNQALRPGDRVVNRARCGLCLEDYFWSQDDMRGAFEKSGFELLDVCRTLGTPGQPFEWKAELEVATDYVFTFQKPPKCLNQ